MTKYLTRLFYLGDRYHGSQHQPELKTVQGELIQAVTDWSGEHHSTQTTQFSGRTDRGVHSVGQLVMIETNEQLNIDKINRYLPDDIILWASIEAPLNFAPRYDVLMRHYRYYLDKSWATLNLGAVKKAASLLIGSNDFNELAKPDSGRNTVTTILNISVFDHDDIYYLDIYGTRFLWKLVRKLVSLLMEIGTGKIRLDMIDSILSEQRVLASGIKPAPPENLVLIETIVPFKMKLSKYAIKLIQKKLNDQLNQYRRSVITLNNIIDYFSVPSSISQHSTNSQRHSDF
jgi:tRNA pseudouridine38-40 synthase